MDRMIHKTRIKFLSPNLVYTWTKISLALLGIHGLKFLSPTLVYTCTKISLA
jgi:hypothetical protein